MDLWFLISGAIKLHEIIFFGILIFKAMNTHVFFYLFYYQILAKRLVLIAKPECLWKWECGCFIYENYKEPIKLKSQD